MDLHPFNYRFDQARLSGVTMYGKQQPFNNHEAE